MNISRIYHPYIRSNSNLIIKNNRFNYIKNVLRKKVNDKIIVFDGINSEYYASIISLKKTYLTIKINDKLVNKSTEFLLNVGQPIIKRKKFEFILEKSNEIGAFSFTPLITDFVSKNYLKNNTTNKMIHLEKKIVSSSEQSGRNDIMILNKIKTIKSFCESIKYINSIKIYLQPFAKNEFLDIFITLKKEKRYTEKKIIFILVGPEGGFSQEEVLLLNSFDFVGYNISNNILCSETCMIASLSILSNMLQYLKKLK